MKQGKNVENICCILLYFWKSLFKVESLEELSPKDKVDFVCWMQSHHISYSLYKDVMEDKAPLRLYIPFAKVNFSFFKGFG